MLIAFNERPGNLDVMAEVAAVHDEVDLLSTGAGENLLQPFRRLVPVPLPVVKVGKDAEFDSIHSVLSGVWFFAEKRQKKKPKFR